MSTPHRSMHGGVVPRDVPYSSSCIKTTPKALTSSRLKWQSIPAAGDITSVYHGRNLSNEISYLSPRRKLKLLRDAPVICLGETGRVPHWEVICIDRWVLMISIKYFTSSGMSGKKSRA